MRPTGRILRGINRRLRGRGTAVQQLARLGTRIGQVPRSGDEHWEALRAEVVELTTGLSAGDWQDLPLHQRIAVWLVVEDRRADLVVALVDRSENGRSFVTDIGTDLVARTGYLGLLSADVPQWLRVPHSKDLTLAVHRTIVALPDEHRVVGSAFIRSIELDPARDRVVLRAVGPSGARDVAVESFTDPEIDATSDERWCSQARSGFRAVIGSTTLAEIGGTARLELEVTCGAVSRTAELGEIGREERPAASVELESAVVVDGALIVVGRHGAAPRPVTVRLVGARRTLEAPVTATGSGFTAAVPLVVGAWGRPGLAPETGDYAVEVVDDEGTASPADLAPALDAGLPVNGSTPLVAVRLSRHGRQALVQMRSPLPVSERGRLNQRLLAESVWSVADPVLEDSILATCFSGRSGGDSVEPVVRELQVRLGHPVRWGVADHSVPAPEGFDPVLIHSRAWHEALHTSRILVNNAHFPAYFRLAAGQTYLQTWHGTPLKKIGADVPPTALSLSYRALMGREAAAWSLLLAQGPYAEEVLAGALGYQGPVLAQGYPRNDVLRAPDAAARRVAARQMLGLADDQMAVLYAPTWRDDARTDGRQDLVSHLDADQLQRRLGDRVVVLLRGHSNTSRGREVQTGAGVVDVTDHPDVSTLFLAADVLVTDYSSVMFDFCVTGRPMVFLAPDLEHYRDSTRGFYLDYEETVPGPVVATTDEVADALVDLPGLGRRYADRQAEFVARFAPYDDGHATERVVDALLDRFDA